MPKLYYSRQFVAGIFLHALLIFGGNLAAQSVSPGFSLTGPPVTEKDTFVVALNADSLLTGQSVYAYRFYITYSPYYFEFAGMEGTGPVLAAWGSPVLNDSNPGTLILAGAGTSPLEGNGEMVYLKFVSLSSGNSTISFNTTESYLNEGNPASVYTNATIYSAARSYPNIYPDSRTMFVGDEIKMTVSGGIAPYTYSADNPAVAVITNSDTLRATGPGTTKVRVTDSNGEVSVSSGLFDVRAVRMDFGEVSVWPADTFYLPVNLQVAPGTAVYSGRFDLTFNNGLTALPEDVLQGDYQLTIAKNPQSGRLSISFASTTPVTGNGVLCYLPFRANYSGNQYIYPENMRFNESLLALTTKSSYRMEVKYLPTLSMTPSSGTLMWGDVLKINVYNGTAPYTYQVSDTALASIDAQGNLQAKTGGNVYVSARDDNGATMTSGLFKIADNKVTIYDTDGIPDSETRVPLVTSSLPPGKAIFSYKAGITFDDTYLDFVRIDPAGTGDLVQASLSGNTIEAAAALTNGVSTGVVGFLVFKIKTTLPLNSTTMISLNTFSGNERSLNTVPESGNITRVEQTSYRPVAVAGIDFSVSEGSTGQLDGSASFDLDNNPLTYSWHAPAGIVLSDSTSAKPEFQAPYVSKDTILTFTLVVNDGTTDSDPSDVHVTIRQVNFPPTADAGPDLKYAEGSSVSLDGSLSYDPDGDAISYKWTALDGIVLFNPTGVKPSFILPQVSVNTVYRFTLVVNDGALNSAPDTVTITAIQVNKKPVAFAGGDFSVNENEQATLDGSLSYDPDNDPITYKWTAPSQVTLSSTTVPKPTFTAPPVLHDSVLVFSLVVNDGNRDSDPDIVRVSVINLDILSTRAMIDSVFMPQLDSFAIDTVNAHIMLYVPYGTDTRSLAPAFTLSKGATVYPPGGSTQDLSMPVYYNVTAEDGTTGRMWKTEIYRPVTVMQRSLSSGWNWISLNVQPPDISVSGIFSSLTLSDLDYLKSSEYSSVYYGATGWFGNLVNFPANRVVRFKKNLAENLLVQGTEINPSITGIALQKGWNDIAYLLRSNTPVNGAIPASSLPAGDIVLKGLTGSAIYYPGSGWVGELDSLRVLRGYKINVQSAGNLVYNADAITKKKSAFAGGPGHDALVSDYGLHPENFEYSSTLVAEVKSDDGKDLTGEGDLLFAYSGDEIRGVSRAVYIAGADKYIFVLTCYSNDENRDITFKVKLSGRDTLYLADHIMNFKADAVTGGALHPQPLFIRAGSLDERGQTSGHLFVYPNPVSDQLTIHSTQALTGIRLYDMTGKMILGPLESAGRLTLQLQDLGPGIYTLKAESAGRVFIRKIIKTSY